MTTDSKREPVWVTPQQINDHVKSFGQPGYVRDSMEGFTEGHGLIPVDGGVYQVVYDRNESQIVVTIDFRNGISNLPVDHETGEELSDDLLYAEIKAWRKA